MLSMSSSQQIETILQLLGSAALVQLAGKKLLFAEVSSYTFIYLGSGDVLLMVLFYLYC